MPTMQLCRLIAALAVAFACAAGLASTPAYAANTYTVDSSVDTPDASLADVRCRTAENECTLRAAIQQANATANLPDGPDQIVFVVGGRFDLTAQLPRIDTDMDIRGPGALSLTLWGNADAQQRVFSITHPARVRISGLTIAHGWASEGGGILNSAELSITDCVLWCQAMLSAERSPLSL
jgi:CSLREA domain-containing protein